MSITKGLTPVSMGVVSASGQGTAINFTGIPTGVKRIQIGLAGISTGGVTLLKAQLGTASGYETTGYSSGTNAVVTNTNGTHVATSTGLALTQQMTAAQGVHGIYTLILIDPATNTWAGSGVITNDSTQLYPAAGSKSLSGVLDRLRIMPDNGADSFDAGKINIYYE